MLDPKKQVPSSIFFQLTAIPWIDFTDPTLLNQKLNDLIQLSLPTLHTL
jgi:hypothetical protein